MISSDPIFRRDRTLPITNGRIVRFKGAENEPLLEQIGALRLQVGRAAGTTINVPRKTLSWRDSHEDVTGLHLAVLRGEKLLAATRLNVSQRFVDMPGHD